MVANQGVFTTYIPKKCAMQRTPHPQRIVIFLTIAFLLRCLGLKGAMPSDRHARRPANLATPPMPLMARPTG